MRNPERMAGRAGCRHGRGRAARALGARPRRVLPEAKCHSDRARAGAQERDCAVDAAAHRDCDPPGVGLRDEDLPERGRERLDGERIAPDGRGLEQAQAGQGPVEPVGVRAHDALAVDCEPHGRPVAVLRRVSEDVMSHPLRLAGPTPSKHMGVLASARTPMQLHPADEATANCEPGLARWVPCGGRQRLSPTPAPFTCLLVHVRSRSHAQGRATTS